MANHSNLRPLVKLNEEAIESLGQFLVVDVLGGYLLEGKQTEDAVMFPAVELHYRDGGRAFRTAAVAVMDSVARGVELRARLTQTDAKAENGRTYRLLFDAVRYVRELVEVEIEKVKSGGSKLTGEEVMQRAVYGHPCFAWLRQEAMVTDDDIELLVFESLKGDGLYPVFRALRASELPTGGRLGVKGLVLALVGNHQEVDGQLVLDEDNPWPQGTERLQRQAEALHREDLYRELPDGLDAWAAFGVVKDGQSLGQLLTDLLEEVSGISFEADPEAAEDWLNARAEEAKASKAKAGERSDAPAEVPGS